MNKIIIDVREEFELNSGRVEGSLHVPLKTLNDSLLALQKHKEDKIIVVCQSGGRAAIACNILSVNGFRNVENGGSWMNFV